MQIRIREMDENAAQALLEWRYEAPYEMYHLQDESARQEVISYLLDPANQFFRMDDTAGELVAFCSFGEDARVNGGDYSRDALDVGLGLRPDLTGKGLGTHFISALLAYAAHQYQPVAFRVTIAAFNLRAQKAWQAHGFIVEQTFLRTFDQMPFKMLVLPIDPGDDPAAE